MHCGQKLFGKQARTWLLLGAAISFGGCERAATGVQTNLVSTYAETVVIPQVSSDGEVLVQPTPVPDSRPEAVARYLYGATTGHSPLVDFAQELVDAADYYDLDWRLLPALSMQESSGGVQACGYNPFGWGSCGIPFSSWDEAIWGVAQALAQGRYYAGLDIRSKLCVYQSGHGCWGRADEYAGEVLAKMGQVGG